MSPNLKRTLRRILRESSEVRPVLSFGAVLVHAPLGRGLRGEVVVRLGKDRAGAVSPHCGPLRKSDHTQEAARVVFDSTGTSLEIAVNPPATGADRDGGYRPFRPTYLMEQVSRVIEENPGADRDGGYRPSGPPTDGAGEPGDRTEPGEADEEPGNQQGQRQATPGRGGRLRSSGERGHLTKKPRTSVTRTTPRPGPTERRTTRRPTNTTAPTSTPTGRSCIVPRRPSTTARALRRRKPSDDRLSPLLFWERLRHSQKSFPLAFP